jgi:hypothetical protein
MNMSPAPAKAEAPLYDDYRLPTTTTSTAYCPTAYCPTVC